MPWLTQPPIGFPGWGGDVNTNFDVLENALKNALGGGKETVGPLQLAGTVAMGSYGIGNDNPILTFAAGGAGEATFAGDVDVASGKVFRVNDTQVVGAQQSHIADASTSHDVSGNDRVEQATVESGLDALGSKINSILSALEAHGLMASS